MPWAYDDPVPLREMAERLRGFRADFDRGEQHIYGVFQGAELAAGGGLHPRVGGDAFEIGYWVRADRVRQGLATELAAALTRVGFDVCGVERLEIHADARNTPSQGIPRRLGYVEEATLRRRLPPCPPGAERGDVTIFSLLEDEFRASELAAFPVEAYDLLGERVL